MRLRSHHVAYLLCLTLTPLTLFAAEPPAAPPTSRMPMISLLLVANQKDRTLSVLDAGPGSGATSSIAAIPLSGTTGHEVTTSPDGHTAYVPIYGNSGVGKPGTDGSTMDVIDIPSRRVTTIVDFGHPVRPHQPTWDPHTNLLYVTTELDHTISVIDPRTNKIVGTVPTGQAESHMMALAHDGAHAYTANVGPGTVSVLDMKARKLVKIIPVSGNVQRIAISNDDKLVFTSDQTKPELDVIDTATNTVKSRIELPGKGYGSAPTRDGRYLLLCITGTKQVAVIDLAAMKVTHTIDLPIAPTEVIATPDGHTAFASGNGKVASIDLADFTLRTMLDAGAGADGLAFAH